MVVLLLWSLSALDWQLAFVAPAAGHATCHLDDQHDSHPCPEGDEHCGNSCPCLCCPGHGGAVPMDMFIDLGGALLARETITESPAPTPATGFLPGIFRPPRA